MESSTLVDHVEYHCSNIFNNRLIGLYIVEKQNNGLNGENLIFY